MSTLRALNGATPQTGEFIVTRAVVRVRTANGSGRGIVHLVEHLRDESFSGTVTLIMQRGTLRTIRLEDRAEIDG
jgi:hypothetical protein